MGSPVAAIDRFLPLLRLQRTCGILGVCFDDFRPTARGPVSGLQEQCKSLHPDH